MENRPELELIRRADISNRFESAPISFLGGGFNSARYRDYERSFQRVRPSNIIDLPIKTPSIPSRLKSFFTNLIS